MNEQNPHGSGDGQPHPQQAPLPHYMQRPATPQYPSQPGYPAQPGQPSQAYPHLQPSQPTQQAQAYPPAQPAYAAVYSPYYYQQHGLRPPMSQLAIWAFVSSFFIGILGVVLGAMAAKRIGNQGLRGVGFAMAGFYIGIFVAVLQLVIGLFVIIVAVATAAPTAY